MLYKAKFLESNRPAAGLCRISSCAAALLALSFRALPASADTGAAKGKVETVSLPTALVRPFRGEAKRSVIVCMPPGYGDAANATRRYPVVYLLHGSPGNPLNFLRYGHFPDRLQAAVQAGAMQPAIFVIPNGNSAGEKHGDGEWANSADRHNLFEDWIVREIVPWTDAHYRTIADPSGRLLSGVSEGGFGAVNLALRNPKIFGGAVGLSGYYDMRNFGWGHITFGDSEVLMSLNSPLFYVPDRTANGRIPPEWKYLKIFVGAGADEKPYADHTRRVGVALRAAGIRTVIVETPEGKHDWNLWSTLFFRAMSDFLPANGKGT